MTAISVYCIQDLSWTVRKTGRNPICTLQTLTRISEQRSAQAMIPLLPGQVPLKPLSPELLDSSVNVSNRDAFHKPQPTYESLGDAVGHERTQSTESGPIEATNVPENTPFPTSLQKFSGSPVPLHLPESPVLRSTEEDANPTFSLKYSGLT